MKNAGLVFIDENGGAPGGLAEKNCYQSQGGVSWWRPGLRLLFLVE